MLGKERSWVFYAISFSLISTACDKETSVPGPLKLAFLGHIYQPDRSNRIDRRLANVDYGRFDAILLGGDVCVETTENQETLRYLDDLFNLGKSTTHWTLGNHDVRNGNRNWISEITMRNSFYYQDLHGLRIVVLNTTLTDCGEMEAQFEMFQEAISSSQDYSQMLIISHHAIWTAYLEGESIKSYANARHSIWRAVCNIHNDATFESTVLPLLKSVGEAGKSIVWIAGDYGQMISTFQHRDPDHQIVYLGSGIAENGRLKADSVLTLTWHTDQAELLWNFVKTETFAEEYE